MSKTTSPSRAEKRIESKALAISSVLGVWDTVTLDDILIYARAKLGKIRWDAAMVTIATRRKPLEPFTDQSELVLNMIAKQLDINFGSIYEDEENDVPSANVNDRDYFSKEKKGSDGGKDVWANKETSKSMSRDDEGV